MSDCFAQRVRASRRIKALSDEMIVPRSDWDSYYHHFTLRVKSLSEYIDVIGRLSGFAKKTEYDQLVFRGHSDASSKYKLIPTIGRKKHIIEYCENNMVSEMLTLRPEEFEGIQSNFDLLSKLQHFGLPTRILDFTYNPLIALYFACCSPHKTDSRVVCTYDTSDNSTFDIIEKICGIYQFSDYRALSLDQIIGGVSQLRRYTNATRFPLMARPKYSNDRIKHQSAVFMVFPNVAYDYLSHSLYIGKLNDNDFYKFAFSLHEDGDKLLDCIQREPDVYNGLFYVSANTIKELLNHYRVEYSDFENKQTHEISEKYRFIFKNRFYIIDKIQELSDETISNSFISILIESKYRQSIIQELSTIGIDKAFVFPELEYTAQMVKNKYF